MGLIHTFRRLIQQGRIVPTFLYEELVGLDKRIGGYDKRFEAMEKTVENLNKRYDILVDKTDNIAKNANRANERLDIIDKSIPLDLKAKMNCIIAQTKIEEKCKPYVIEKAPPKEIEGDTIE